MTQFGRAMRSLDIDIICANTPQAKGRVERANLTLQDRLVKEMRLKGVSTIADANAFASEFIADFNHRFAVEPRSNHDAHRPHEFSETELNQIFSLQESRILSKNLTIQYNKVVYQIQTSRPSYALRKAQVTVCESLRAQSRFSTKASLWITPFSSNRSVRPKYAPARISMPISINTNLLLTIPGATALPPPLFQKMNSENRTSLLCRK